MKFHDLQPYPAMRPLAASWIDHSPTHWRVLRLKALLTRNESGVWGREAESNGVVVLRSTEQTVSGEWDITAPAKRELTVSEYRSCQLKEGDLVVTKSSGSALHIGKTSIVTKDIAALNCCFSNFTQRLRVKSDTMPRFVWYLLNGKVGREQLDYLSDTTTHADRRIQRYIRAKERLIELLEEQKQAIIHQAVTGQINVRTGQPYPAYKDSSVGWLGPIPVHWERCRLRNVVSEVTTGSRGWSSYAADEGPLFVRVANLSRGSLELRFDDIVRLDLPSTSEASRTRIRENDLLLSVTAYIGAVGVVPLGFEEAYVSQHVARCKPLRRVHAKWLGYVLLSSIGQTHGQMCLYGGTKDGLSLEDVRNYPILIPPRDEQDRLVRWIDRELALLTIMGDQTDKQIDLLHEYRTRLVADVVTGKLDVREAAASLPETDPLIADDSDNNPKTNVTTHGDFPNFAHPHP